MSQSWSGELGKNKIEWLSIPRGPQGTASVRINGQAPCVIRWKRDEEGLILELPNGVRVFDWVRDKSDEGTPTVTLSERVGDKTWSGLKWLDAGEEKTASSQLAQGKKKGTRIRSQMPGKIVRIMVKEGQEVVKDQPMIVMEAMKMENEIRSPGPGRVKEVKVVEAQAVDSGADLLVIE